MPGFRQVSVSKPDKVEGSAPRCVFINFRKMYMKEGILFWKLTPPITDAWKCPEFFYSVSLNPDNDL